MGHQDKKIPKKTENSGQKRQELKTHTHIYTQIITDNILLKDHVTPKSNKHTIWKLKIWLI